MTQVKTLIKDNYNLMLLNDFLRKEIKEAGFSKVEVAKTPTGTRITLYVTKPGIVIGRKGTGIKELTSRLETDFQLKNPQIAVEEIKKPELSPNVMCNRMASHIQRGTAFRRVTMWTLQQIMESGAMGVQITISGKLRGDRSAFEKHSLGILPRAGHHAEIVVEEDIAHVETPMGLIGIRIRIAQKEKIIPEFELNEKISKRKSDAKADVESDAKADVESDAKADVESDAKADVESDAKADVESDAKADVESDAKADVESDAKSESEEIVIEEEKIKKMKETLEEEEAEFK